MQAATQLQRDAPGEGAGGGGTPQEEMQGEVWEDNPRGAVGVALNSCSLVLSLAPCACLWWPLWSWQRLDGKAWEPPRSG